MSAAPIVPATGYRACVPLECSANVTVVPADPPRDALVAFWAGPAGTHGVGWPDLGSAGEVELVLPAGRSLRRRRVPARMATVAEALPVLTLGSSGEGSASFAAWSAAALAGVGLVAQGRLLPARSPAGFGAWRVGPLTGADQAWLRDVAAALPPAAYAVPVAGSGRLRVRSPETLVRAFWDAIADTLVRTPAAELAVPAPAFAGCAPTAVAGSAEWLAAADEAERTGVRVALRLELPEEGDEAFRGVLQLRSAIDPSLVVDVADLWQTPASVLARLGESAETDLLLGLRRGARAWPPLAPLLDQAGPTVLPLDDDDLSDLLDEGATALESTGIDVLLPHEFLDDGLTVTATAGTPSPGAVTDAGLSLDELLELRWQPSLGGEPLSEQEMAELSEAKRAIVRLRGRWVRIDPHLLERLRRRRTRRLSTVEALAAALAGQLELDGQLVEFRAAGGLADLVRHVGELTTRGEAPVPAGLTATLRPYQRRGLDWLAQLTDLGLGGCLADDMGLGKTVQVIALHLHRHETGPAGPTLVVCPTSLLGNWEREIARFAPGTPVRRYHGGQRHLDELAKDEVVLATYGMVRRDQAALAEQEWGLVVADEVQHAKNPLSRTARALRGLPGAARVALTGTPVENRLSDLWAILDWTVPGLLGPLDRFRHSVAVPVERYRDPDATERLGRLVRPFLLRRRKSDPGIAPELPAKTETDVVVPLTTEQGTLYEAVVREALAKIADSDGMARRGMVLGLLTALKQVCNHPAQYLREPGPLVGRSGKLAALDELLEVILDEGEAVLVFSQYVQMCRLLQTHLRGRGVPSAFLHGGVPAAARQAMVEEFQSGTAPVFLLSLKAGGVGLNLTRATHVVHFDRWWNPAVEDQATDRAYRIGQDRPVQVHRLVAEGTVEDRIAALLAGKRRLADAVVGSGEGWLTELSDADLADLVRLGNP